MPDRGYRQAKMDLAVLKALGDETRFAMYRELATATSPLSAHELADRLGLHANTVRLHLDRLREVGLVDVEAVHRGTVGRPQHRLLRSPPARRASASTRPRTPCSPGLLAALAERIGADVDDAADTGRAWGVEAGRRTRSRSRACRRSTRDAPAGLRAGRRAR